MRRGAGRPSLQARAVAAATPRRARVLIWTSVKNSAPQQTQASTAAVVVDTARCLRARPLVAAPPRKEGKARSSGPSIHFEAVMKLYSWTRAGVLESKGPSCPTVLAERGQEAKGHLEGNPELHPSGSKLPPAPAAEVLRAPEGPEVRNEGARPHPTRGREWPVCQLQVMPPFANRRSNRQHHHLGPGHPPTAKDGSRGGLGCPPRQCCTRARLPWQPAHTAWRAPARNGCRACPSRP